MRILILILALGIIVSCGTNKQPAPDYNAELIQLFEDYKNFQFYTYPEYASYEGNNDYADRLTNQSSIAGELFIDSIRKYKAVLLAMDTAALTETNQLNFSLFLFTLDETINEYDLKIGNYLNFTQQGGFHIYIPQIIDYQPFETDTDIKNYYSRLKQFKIECRNIITNLKEGQQKGIILPCNITTQVLAQLEGLANMPIETSPFYMIYEKNEKLKADPTELKLMIDSNITIGYQELYQDVFSDQYLDVQNASNSFQRFFSGLSDQKKRVRTENPLRSIKKNIKTF